MKYQCLIIDDDLVIAQSTAEYFNMFDIKTAYVTGYEDAENFFAENEVSLVLLDINLGNKSGFELCRKIRQNLDMPIFFISARTSDYDVLTALNIGGDDYIKKPYTLNILLAKVKASLRRYETASASLTSSENTIAVTRDILLDTDSMKILKKGGSIFLKSMEYKVLHYLLTNRNRVITKDEFFEKVWKEQYISDGTLSVHIRHLREKIEKDPNNPVIIKTVWGVGYIIDEKI